VRCGAPETFAGLPREIFDFFGKPVDELAEDLIFDDYVREERVNEFTSIFPKRNSDGTQLFRDVRGLNTQLFIAFLAQNNPGLDINLLATQALKKGAGIKNPDWAIDRKVRLEFEHYEVKPKSDTSKGRAKILSLIAFCGFNHLPYGPGINYTPVNETHNLWVESSGFVETKVNLQWTRKEPGLIMRFVSSAGARRRWKHVLLPWKLPLEVSSSFYKPAVIMRGRGAVGCDIDHGGV
jgi:hypothetical protein